METGAVGDGATHNTTAVDGTGVTVADGEDMDVVDLQLSDTDGTLSQGSTNSVKVSIAQIPWPPGKPNPDTDQVSKEVKAEQIEQNQSDALEKPVIIRKNISGSEKRRRRRAEARMVGSQSRLAMKWIELGRVRG